MNAKFTIAQLAVKILFARGNLGFYFSRFDCLNFWARYIPVIQSTSCGP
jgi:hypothetical protein